MKIFEQIKWSNLSANNATCQSQYDSILLILNNKVMKRNAFDFTSNYVDTDKITSIEFEDGQYWYSVVEINNKEGYVLHNLRIMKNNYRCE